MKRLLLAVFALLTVAGAQAQLLSWNPPFPRENDNSQSLVITVDATKGNQGLLNYTPNSDVYVHIGVITSASTSPSDWKYTKFTWGTTNAAANAPYVSANKWQYTITGSLRTFFGITNASETIQKIAILFRNGAGSRVQRNTDGGDMYIPVYPTGSFQTRVDEPFRMPNYTMTAETQNWSVGTAFNVKGSASTASSMKLYHNGTQIAAATGVTTLSGNSTVAGFGVQTIVSEANNGTTSVYDTIKIFVGPASSPVAALPAGVVDGVNYTSNTTATLVLRAPNKTKATVIGDFNNWTEDLNYVMNRTPDGKFFWLNLTGLTAGTQYAFQYKVDDTIRIADPYSTMILDPWNDQFISATTYPGLKPYPTGKTTGIVGVLQTAAPTYTWNSNSYSRPDKRTLVAYELLVRDFLANPNWDKLTDTLSYFKNLGINAIEIMPFNEFEGNLSWGYNPDFYFAPDKYYGRPETLKRFIDSCHANGIAIIMDIALNHSFGLSPMVQLYWDPSNNRPAANNPWFNQTDRHPFGVGYDFNHQSPDTRYFTSRVMQYWTNEYRIDGFRFDLSKGFTQNQTNDVGSWSNYDQSRIDIWKAYYDTLNRVAPGAYSILEHFAANSEETVLANYGHLFWGNLHTQYKNSALGFANNDANLDWGLFTARGWNQPHLMTYAESHDEERLMYEMLNFGNNSQANYNVRNLNTALKRMELIGAFLFIQPGPKMFWQFGELGYDYSINYCANGTINSSCRTDAKPVRWDYNTVAERRNIYDVWAKVIKLRSHPWFRANFTSNRVFGPLTGNFRWFQITTDTSNITVVGNFDVVAQSGTVTFQNAGTWYDYLNNTTFTATGNPQTINLLPGEYRIYVNRNVNNVGTTPVSNLVTDGSRLDAGVYPNPAKGQFVVDLFLPAAAQTSFELVNGAGQVVRSLRQSFLPRGRQLITLDRPGIPAGTYYLRIAAKGGMRVLPLILQ
ncbi:alpha-amylase family glycosyl hydrolase [Flaviaesturariibacter amylovorans]|uniref:Glycosyl hydrolase family 13 catalytic domain-containing protein n=1 Tax=Flaviaesturariibacter amylovorans TaxID=1084520 RepID=A0ABP8HQA5_9BACT